MKPRIRQSLFFLVGSVLTFLMSGGILFAKTYSQSLSLEQGAMTIVTTQPGPTMFPTIYYQNGGPFFTDPLMCPKDVPLRQGLSWRGIVIGKSYLFDLEDLYGVRATRISMDYFHGSFADLYGITLTGRASIERKLALGFQACIVDGKVAALAVVPVNDIQLSDYLEGWITKFGPPEIISWPVGVGESYRYRTLIWPKQGLALYVDRGDFSPKGALVTTVIFLPPVRDPADLAKWPYSQLQTTPRISSQGEDPGPLNPFNFEAMKATQEPTSSATATP